MRVWIYSRLSNDDDPEQNSLTNQERICREHAKQNGCTVVGSSSDDNISGMTFPRPGLRKLSEAAENGSIEAILVKDLSRLGRHKTQTALFIEYLRERNIAVISVTEGLNTLTENDDLIVGIRVLMNDFYAKDIGAKIRAGFRQKQKDGLVIIPPFGYWKNKNTGTVEVIEEAANTVRRIYSMYLSGIGLIQIARQLTAEHRRTPAQLQFELYNRHFGNAKPYMWSFTSVKNILQDESYIGTLTNHRREITSGRTRYIPEAEYYRHENFYPPIVSREDWLAAQDLLSKAPSKAVSSPPSRHRYAGLLECGDCHSPLIAINRRWNSKTRVEYICKTYMRHGKAVCLSHRIHEEVIDSALYEKLSELRYNAQNALLTTQAYQKLLSLKAPVINAKRLSMLNRVAELEAEIDEIVMEKLKA